MSYQIHENEIKSVKFPPPPSTYQECMQLSLSWRTCPLLKGKEREIPVNYNDRRDAQDPMSAFKSRTIVYIYTYIHINTCINI